MKRQASIAFPATAARASRLLVLALALGSCGGAGDDAVVGSRREAASVDGAPALDLVAVPHPELAVVSEELRRQIEALRLEIESAPAGADREWLGQAWGDLARAYHAYGFSDAASAAYENARLLMPTIALWAHAAGLLERQRGRHEQAVERFRRALEIDPEAAASRLQLGESLLDLGRAREAVEVLERASSSRPHAAAAFAALGRAARELGDPAGAVERYRRALALQPEADLLHHSLAAAYRGLGDETSARAELERAGDTAPSYPDPVAEGIDELRTTAGALLLRGSRALASERPREAIEHYRRAVAADPRDAEARRSLALALRAAGDLDEALRELEEAARLAPDSHLVAFDLANVQLARGAQEAAADAFARTLELAPDFAPARFNLANAQLLLGDAAAALANLERVIELDPGHRRARYQAAMAKSRLGRSEEAVADLESLLEADPGFVPALLGLGELRRQRGDSAGARRALEEAVRRGAGSGSEVEARQALAGLGRAEGRTAEEIEQLQAAAEAAPARDDVREELARALERAGRFLEAAQEREVLVGLRPDVAMARVLEAADWVQAGRAGRARERLEEAYALQPGDRLIANSLARLLATAREPEVRDGRRALEIARRLHAEQPSPDVAETLAMAHAEAGDFGEAVAVQRRLIEDVRAAGQTGHLPRLEESLRRYERREPLRM